MKVGVIVGVSVLVGVGVVVGVIVAVAVGALVAVGSGVGVLVAATLQAGIAKTNIANNRMTVIRFTGWFSIFMVGLLSTRAKYFISPQMRRWRNEEGLNHNLYIKHTKLLSKVNKVL